MAIVPRETKKGIVYWVVTKGHGERVGMNRQAADRLNERRKKEVKAGTYSPAAPTGAVTVGSFLTKWLDGRSNRSADLERTMLRIHVLEGCEWLASMKMEDVRSVHAKKFIGELKARASQKSGKPIKPKYVANVNGVMKAAFRAAVLDEVIERDVWVHAPGVISKKSEPKVPYSRDEAGAMLDNAERGRRVWLALAFYTGMRAGEVCGRRWSDWAQDATPLGCLTIGTQYQDQPLKTDRPRKAPVHPELEAILRTWWDTGFEIVYLRKPTLRDFIVPAYPTLTKALTRGAAYKAIVADCRRASVPSRGMHATRHTFVSAVQRGGADQKVVERITHNASGAMIDHYTHREWDELCAAMSCLRPYGRKLVATLYSENSEGKNTVESGSDSRTRTKNNSPESPEYGEQGRKRGAKGGIKTRAAADLDAVLDTSKDPDEADFRVALVEHGARADVAAELSRPLAKSRPYVAKKRAPTPATEAR